MKSTLLVPFGLKDDRLYEPTQVPNGKACGCVCPACKKPLVAKQNASTPHFAHSQDENCSKGLETAVHLAVKQIIAEKMRVRLPAVVWKNPFPRYNQTLKVYTERTIRLESVVLEQVIDDFIPDIVVVADGTTYFDCVTNYAFRARNTGIAAAFERFASPASVVAWRSSPAHAVAFARLPRGR